MHQQLWKVCEDFATPTWRTCVVLLQRGEKICPRLLVAKAQRVFLQQVLPLVRRQPELRQHGAPIPICLAPDTLEESTFEGRDLIGEGLIPSHREDALLDAPLAGAQPIAQIAGEIPEADIVVGAESQERLQRVLQLAEVARPLVVEETTAQLVTEPGRGAPKYPRFPSQEVLEVEAEILFTFPQRWDAQTERSAAVEELIAECATLLRVFQWQLGRLHKAQIDRRWTRLANRSDFAVVEHTQ